VFSCKPSVADMYNSHIPYLGALQPKLAPNISSQAYAAVILVARAPVMLRLGGFTAQISRC